MRNNRKVCIQYFCMFEIIWICRCIAKRSFNFDDACSNGHLRFYIAINQIGNEFYTLPVNDKLVCQIKIWIMAGSIFETKNFQVNLIFSSFVAGVILNIIIAKVRKMLI